MATGVRDISAARIFPGGCGKALLMAWFVVLLAQGLAACKKAVSEQDFVGKWQSSRAVTPIHLAANGEWEIRKDDGTVLQYGIWRYEGKKITWTIKQGSQLSDDVNPVLSITETEFQLAERDGTTTVFKRLQ